MEILAKRSVPILLVLGIVWLALPVWGADKNKDEETIRNATTVLQAMVGGKDIPLSTVAKADCIIILPSVKKFAVGIGGTGGRGPMTCREGANFTGKWSTARHVQHRRRQCRFSDRRHG